MPLRAGIEGRRLVVLISSAVLFWLAGALLSLLGADRDAVLALALPLLLACGIWAAAAPVSSRLYRLFPGILIAGLLLPGGLGGVLASLAWVWFWGELGRALRPVAARTALGLLLAGLFFAPFWVRAFWPQGGAGATLSAFGGPILMLSRAFAAHGGSFDPRLGMLYDLWYGTDYPVPSPQWWRFALTYALGGGIVAGLHEALARLRASEQEAALS